MTNDLPDWVTPGGTAYLHHYGRVTKAKITKITARDIVVGTYRFRKDRLTRPFFDSGDLYFEGPRNDYHHPTLLGPNDPRIEQSQKAQKARLAENEARNAAEAWQKNRTVEKARETIAALEAWIKVSE